MHGTPKRLDELAGHAIVGFDQDVVSARAIAASGLPLTREMFAFRTDNQLAQLAAIRAGCGISICQMGLASHTPKLARLLPDMVAVPIETWITIHEDLRSDQRMRLTFDHLHQAITAYAAIS